jgi:hypothetical protein
MNIFSIKNIFSKWTNFNYNFSVFKFFCKTIIINEHFYYVNKFHIWTFFLYVNYFSYKWTFLLCEQVSYMNIYSYVNYFHIFSFMNIFQLWTYFSYMINFIFDHFKCKNKFHIWTNFIYEHFSFMNIFSKWTKFNYNIFLLFKFLLKQLLLINIFHSRTFFLNEQISFIKLPFFKICNTIIVNEHLFLC